MAFIMMKACVIILIVGESLAASLPQKESKEESSQIEKREAQFPFDYGDYDYYFGGPPPPPPPPPPPRRYHGHGPRHHHRPKPRPRPHHHQAYHAPPPKPHRHPPPPPPPKPHRPAPPPPPPPPKPHHHHHPKPAPPPPPPPPPPRWVSLCVTLWWWWCCQGAWWLCGPHCQCQRDHRGGGPRSSAGHQGRIRGQRQIHRQQRRGDSWGLTCFILIPTYNDVNHCSYHYKVLVC